MTSSVMPATSGYINVSYVSHIASTKFLVSDLHMLYCMCQIYSMESLIDTARPPMVWDLHVSMIKRGSLTLT